MPPLRIFPEAVPTQFRHPRDKLLFMVVAADCEPSCSQPISVKAHKSLRIPAILSFLNTDVKSVLGQSMQRKEDKADCDKDKAMNRITAIVYCEAI